MEGHTLVEIVLRGLHDLQISTLELVVEGHGRNLTGNHRQTAGLLRLILVVIHLGHGVNAGHQVVDLNLALGVGLDSLIDAVAGDGKGEVIHLAILRGLDDLSGAVGHLQIEERLHGVHNSGCVSDRILHGSVRPIVTVTPYDNALTDIVLDGGDGHRFRRCSLSGNGQCVAIARKDNIGQVAAEGIVRHHMIAVGQGSCVLTTVPFQLDRLRLVGSLTHKAGNDRVALNAGFDAVVVSRESTIQRVRSAVHGFHGISTAGVNMVEVYVPLSDDRFPYQHLRSHHVRHFVSIGFILRAPVEGQVTLIAILHDSAQQCLDGIGINGAVVIRWIVLPIILAVSCIGFLQQTGNPRLDAVAGRAIEGTDGVQCGHPCCLTGGPAVHIMQLIMTPSAAVIKISIPTAGEANGIGFCHFAGRRSGKGGNTAAENGCEADQQRHKP